MNVQPNEITEILNRPLSQELLARDLTRLAYIAKDGTPRNVPIAFTWNGSQIVMCTSKNAPKLSALRHNTAVALTIDTEVHPPKILLIRGQVALDVVDGIPDEYLQMNGSYAMTPEQRVEWEAEVRSLLRRHGPHRRHPDLGEAHRLRDHTAERCRGAHPAAGGTSARLTAETHCETASPLWATRRIGGRAPDAGPPWGVRAHKARLDRRRQGLSRPDTARPRPGHRAATTPRARRCSGRCGAVQHRTAGARDRGCPVPGRAPCRWADSTRPEPVRTRSRRGGRTDQGRVHARYGSPGSHADPDRPWAPGGESWNDFVRRVRRTIDEIPARYPDQAVLAVTHAGFIVQFFLSVFAVPGSAVRARLDPDFTGITDWEFDEAGGFWRLIAFNDTAHLSTGVWSGISS